MATEPRIETDEWGEQFSNGWWRDSLGQVGPFRPGVGPRSNPSGWFPTGPEVGERLPPMIAPDHTGRTVDIEADRGVRPAAVVVFRSAVW